MLPAKVRSKLHGLCSIVLVCLCATVLLVLSPERQSTSGLTETAASEELVQINPGASLRPDITAGAKKVFGVDANEGKLLRFSIDKGDLALTTNVYGPTGTNLIEHVSEDFETVELSLPIDVSGTYRIEIQSREKVDTLRTFELKVEALTLITPVDLKDSEARRLMASASVSRAKWTQASLRQAIEEYDKAAASWTSLGNFSSASQANVRSGDIHFLLSEYAEALKRFQNAVTLAAKSDDHFTEAKALNRIGRLYSYTGKNLLAQQHLAKALSLLGPVSGDTDAKIKNAYGEALSDIGEVIYSKGNMGAASEQFKLALEYLRGDRKGEAKAQMFVAYIAGSVGVPEKAITATSEARRLYEATNDRSGEGLALTLLGLWHTVQGDNDRAIELHKKAIGIFQEIGDKNSEAIAFNAVGQAYEYLKDFKTALWNYEKALKIFHDRGALDFEGGTIAKVAMMHRLLGNHEQALLLYERSLKLSRAAGKQRTEANALSEIAIVYAAQQRTKDTLLQYNRLLKFYEGIKDPRGHAVALNQLGSFLLQIGRKEEAAESFRRALREDATDTSVTIGAFYNLARAERALGHLDDAYSTINRSLKIIEDLRSNVGSPDLRASYFSGVQSNYELCIQILTDLDRARPGNGFAAQALLMSDKSRARLLVDLIRKSGADLLKDAPQDLVSRERELSGLIQNQVQYRLELKGASDASEISEVESQLAQFRSELRQIQGRIRDQSPRALSLSRYEPLTLEQVQKELRTDDVLLEFSLGDERSHLWMVTPDSFQYFQLPDRKTIEELSTEVYKLVTTRQLREGQADIQSQIDESDQLFLQKAPELSQMLFGQIATQLGNKRLLLITEGKMQFVPFSALPVAASNAPLISDHEIVQLPSIATLRAIRATENKNRDAADKVAAVIADPVFTRNDTRVQNSALVASAATNENRSESTQRAIESLRSGAQGRLIHSSEEADAIAKAAPRGTTMIVKGFEATRETAMNANLGEFQIVHFATHGIFDSEHPELSGIVLSMVDKNGVEKNGVMPLHDIYNMDLSAELTVLSACQTALGKDIRGEGFVGLTHSFISAGSKSVVSSLWKVDDRATAALMEDLYESMLQKGMSPAAALRAAKLKVMQDKRWSNPYYWAGFVVQGEYTNHINIENNSRRNLGVIVILSLLLISCGLILATKRHKSAKRIS